MAEDTHAEKPSLWRLIEILLERGPALLFIAGLALVVLAVVGGWPGEVELSFNRQVILGSLGAVLTAIGLVLIIRIYREQPHGDPDIGPASSFGVEIKFPVSDVPVTMTKPGESASFEVRGTLKTIPEGAEIWVCIRASDGRRWPHGPADIAETNWKVHEVHPGPGPRKQIDVYVVGKNGQALIKTFKRTVHPLWTVRQKLKKDYPHVAIEIDTPALTDLTTDMVRCAGLTVTLEGNAKG